MKKMYLIVLCLLFGIVESIAQPTQVSGTVKDQNGSPVVGATILVKGTTTGTNTGLDGSFNITAPNSNSILEVSFIGYDTQELPVSANMNIVLIEGGGINVGEVVVTGMTSMDKRLFTGATDRLAADDIRLDGMADISRGLEGRSAGVSVQNVSSTFGTAPKIQIRGATSILGDSKPLWVVDGVILEDAVEVDAASLSSGDAVTLISSAVAGLNSDDIESFQILKDGSATSIYGARAMAGVIVITTKKGRAGAAQINYTGEFTTRLKPNYSEYNIMNSQDQMGIYKELKDKGFLNFSRSVRASKSGVYGKMAQLMNTPDENGNFLVPHNTNAQYAYLRKYEKINTDWFDELFQNSVSMTHSVSISGGTEKYNSYVSMSMMNDPGWYEQSKVSRYTFNANSQYKIRDNLSLLLTGNANYRKQKAPGTLSREVDPVRGDVSRSFDINPFSYAMNTSRTLDPNEIYTMNYAPFNIKNELDRNFMEFNILEAKFQAELKWGIIPGLDASALASLKYYTSNQKHHIMEGSNQAEAYRAMGDATIRQANPYLYSDPDKPNTLPVTTLPSGGFYDKTNYEAYQYDFRMSLNYAKNFNDVHIMNLYGAFEFNQIKRNSDDFRGVGMQYDYGMEPFFDYLAFKRYNEDGASYYSVNNTVRRNVAFMFNGNYSYKGKYIATATFRYEGTNRMGKSNNARWLPTWNVSGGWNMHEENFFQRWKPIFSHMSLRASYSLTADAGPEYVTNTTAIIRNNTPWRPSAGDREPGLMIEMLANKDLTYEKKHELNVGFDAGFMENRFNLSMDVYWRDNYDLIGQTQTQGIGGEIRKYANMADMKSRGVEFTISSKNINNKDFKWTSDFTFSYVHNEITNLEASTNMINLLQGGGFGLQGFSIGSLFSIPFMGLDEDGLPTFMLNNTFIDRHNYGEINFQQRDNLTHNADGTANLKHEGPTDPKITGGLGNVFTYKNWKLNVFMTYAFGNKIRLNPVFAASYSDLTATPKEFKNRWMTYGDEAYTDIPKIASAREVQNISNIYEAYNAYNYSTARIAKGDFIRMKEISVTYDFPKKMVKDWGIGALSLKLQATNPFLIYSDSKLHGQDPEYFQSGGVSSPLAKQFTMTVRVTF